jgi:hypothetical protein
MIIQMKIFFLRLFAILFGIFVGLFIGLIILGTIVRIILDFMFHWGDSGPTWVNWLIGILTLFSIIISSSISIRWTNYYLRKKNL